MTSNPERLGKKLWERLVERNIDHGGVLGEITGAQGTSKTSALLFLADFIMAKRPREKIFLREQIEAPLQVFKLKDPDKYQFFIKDSADMVFQDRSHKLKEVNIPHHKFKTYAELYEKAEPNKVSVPFFDNPAEWMDFIHYLRNAGEWTNILVDEMADIAPSGSSGKQFHRISKFSEDMGAVRRCMMNVLYNTQSVSDVHWKVRKKVMFRVYFRGAKPDKSSRVKQRAIDSLDLNEVLGNEAYIEMGGEFGILRFSEIYTPDPNKHIQITKIEHEEEQ